MNREQPTKNQYRILLFLKEYKKINGVLPTHSKIIDRFGFKSRNSTVQYFEALEKKGYLKKVASGYTLTGKLEKEQK